MLNNFEYGVKFDEFHEFEYVYINSLRQDTILLFPT